VATERPVDFTRESVDLGIRWGYGRWAGLQSEKLMEDECFPVCSPALLPGAAAWPWRPAPAHPAARRLARRLAALAAGGRGRERRSPSGATSSPTPA
jgi:hypothetical protein